MIILIGPGGRVMAFIDDDEIGRRQIHGLALDGAPMQRLDRCDLHALKRTRRNPGLDDAVADAVRAQLVAGLRRDLAAMRQHQNILVELDRRPDDGRGDDRLARCRSAPPG